MKPTPKRKPDHDLLIRIDERQEAQMELLKNILEEAKKTNGRIKALELKQPEIESRIKTAESYFPDIINSKEFSSRWRGALRATAAIGAIVGALVSVISQFILK